MTRTRTIDERARIHKKRFERACQLIQFIADELNPEDFSCAELIYELGSIAAPDNSGRIRSDFKILIQHQMVERVEGDTHRYRLTTYSIDKYL